MLQVIITGVTALFAIRKFVQAVKRLGTGTGDIMDVFDIASAASALKSPNLSPQQRYDLENQMQVQILHNAFHGPDTPLKDVVIRDFDSVTFKK